MYLQITTRCNMSCEHCGFACTEKGEDMSLKTARKAFSIFAGDNVTLGGGEPTIHPKFWQILGIAMENTCDVPPLIITNGSRTRTACALARMALGGTIHCELSQDHYHDPIADRVIRAFSYPKERGYDYQRMYPNDLRGIRNTSSNLIDSGRCNFGTDDGCICEGYLITPSGDIKMCGCEDSIVIGNVHKQVDLEEWQVRDQYGDEINCVKKYREYIEELKEMDEMELVQEIETAFTPK